MNHSLSKEEYTPDKIVSEHWLVRIQLIVSKCDMLVDIAEQKLSIYVGGPSQVLIEMNPDHFLC